MGGVKQADSVDSVKWEPCGCSLLNQHASCNGARTRWNGLWSEAHGSIHGQVLSSNCRLSHPASGPTPRFCALSRVGKQASSVLVCPYMGSALPQLSLPRFTEGSVWGHIAVIERIFAHAISSPLSLSFPSNTTCRLRKFAARAILPQ